MLPRGCCSCCRDENQMAPRDRFGSETSVDGRGLGCVDFCGSYRMSEGRQSQVVLLDDRRLDFLIKPKLYAGELLDMVASHFSLKEKEYFGLAFLDDTGHYSWLQLDRRVLEHEFPKKSAQSTLVLHFRIKYFVESITFLRDSSTVEAFYLQTQSLVYNGIIEVSSEKAFQLAALVLQATHGDYSSDTLARQQLKKLAVLPTSALIDHPSIQICEEKVIDQYRYLHRQSRGSSIVNYMRIAESLPTYGVHYYEVKDKAGIPWWLGISYKGICQYDLTDRKIPRKLFLWKQLENLYFRDRKFSIEVYDPKRVSASRKTFGSGNICVHVWFSSCPSLTRCIWSMAISQHQFYLDRKHNKNALSPNRNLSDIADELSHGSYSTETSSLGGSVSSLSLPALKLDSDSCDETLDTVEMFVALKARKEALEKALRRKCEELKKLCLREGELTGALPPEMPLSPGEQIPIIRRKIGGPVKDRFLWRKKTKDEEELARLELEFDIQSKIVTAAYKLLSDSSVKKNIRRQRKLSHQKAVSKLKELEQKIAFFRKKESRSDDNIYSNTEHSIQKSSANSKDLPINFLMADNNREDANNCHNKMTSSTSSPVPLPSILRSNSNSVPSSPSNPRYLQKKQQRSSFSEKQIILKPDLFLQGYTPSSVYQTRTSYRSQQYPTYSMRSPSTYSTSSSEFDKEGAMSTLTAPFKNKFESTLDLDGSNLYSVPTQRTSQAFDTQDDILALNPVPTQDLGLVSRHNSLDRNKRHSQKYKKYIENNIKFCDPHQRPNSAQPPYDSYTNPCQQHPLYPYQEHFHQQYHVQHPAYAYHPPTQHYRHPDQSHLVQKESIQAQMKVNKDVNLYQKNLKLYAADAMFVGGNRLGEPHKMQQQLQNRLSPTPHKQQWTDKSSCESTPGQSRSPYDSGLISPSSTYERNRSSSKKSTSSVQTSVSVDSFKVHVGPNLQASAANVDIVSYGHYQPYWEETKPYETSDFYKYSTKHRKQHQAASQNLQAKLMAWKANQSSVQAHGSSNAPPVMSPVIERSRTSSPALPTSIAFRREGDKGFSSKNRKEDNINKEANTSVDAFHDEILDWFKKQEKGKKTTLV